MQTERLKAQSCARAAVDLCPNDVPEAEVIEAFKDAPWQAFVQVRLDCYDNLMGDPTVLRKNRGPHTLSLLSRATTSRRRQAGHVLNVLGLEDAFDFMATADDVERTKPHSEIYRLCAVELGVPPEQMLDIEDSPTGTQAALNASLHCIAVGTPFTEARLRADSPLDDRRIVTDPGALLDTVDVLLAETAEPSPSS